MAARRKSRGRRRRRPCGPRTPSPRLCPTGSARPPPPPEMRTGWFEGPLPRILAHRGFAREAPENSLEAFRAALGAGAPHLETDVRATSDGVPVLVHAPRTAADGAEVHRLPLAE